MDSYVHSLRLSDARQELTVSCHDKSFVEWRTHQLIMVSNSAAVGMWVVVKLPSLACHDLLPIHGHAIRVGMVIVFLLLLEVAT